MCIFFTQGVRGPFTQRWVIKRQYFKFNCWYAGIKLIGSLVLRVYIMIWGLDHPVNIYFVSIAAGCLVTLSLTAILDNACNSTGYVASLFQPIRRSSTVLKEYQLLIMSDRFKCRE